MRLTFTSDKTLPLDDTTQNNNLLSRADKDFSDRHAEIQTFIDTYIKDTNVK